MSAICGSLPASPRQAGEVSIRYLSDGDAPTRVLSTPVCVVGAGIAGLLAACRLADKGYRVVVLESGLMSFEPRIHSLNTVDDPWGTYSGALDGRFRGLGGSSSRWGGRMLPLTRCDAGDRSYASIGPWPFDVRELDRYRGEIEGLFHIDNESFEEDVLHVLDRRGALPRNDPDFALRFAKWPTFRRCNLAYLLRDRITKSSALDIWLGGTVCDFDLDPEQGRLVGLVARDLGGRSLHVQADEFVFATGAIEVTRLLLQLDTASNDRVFGRCRALGHYFRDHVGRSVGVLAPRDCAMTNRWFGYHFIKGTRRSLHMELTPAAQKADSVSSAFAQVLIDPPDDSGLAVVKRFLRGLQRRQWALGSRDVFRLAADSCDLARTAWWRFTRRQLFLPADLRLDLSVWIEQAPSRHQRITLSDKTDCLGSPLARIEWRPGEAEERTFRACVGRLASYWARTGLDRICPVVWHDAVSDPEHSLTEGAKDLYHPAGSTRMGNDPIESVVGPDLRCHHLPNVTIASASVFPSTGSANPTYTIIALTFRAVDALAQRLAQI